MHATLHMSVQTAKCQFLLKIVQLMHGQAKAEDLWLRSFVWLSSSW